MDAGRERWRRWLATWTRRISRSPSPHPSGQPASASTGLSGDRSPNHGTTRRQPSNTRAQAQSTTPLHPQHQPPRTQRHRRSSLSDEVEHRPGFGGERDAPRARRPSGATRSENNWRAPVSGSLPDTTMITRRPSRSRSPQGYHTPQEGPAPRGGEMDDALSAPSRWSPPQDVSIRSASPHFRHPDVCESGDGQDHLLPRPQRWDASQGSECAYRHPDQEPITEAPSNDPEFSGRAHQEGLPALNHGVTYNIANAGNVFTGINNGIVYMESATAGSANEFMTNLASRLKICVRADHMYYASGDEAALRRGQCTEGTRVDIIRGIIYWATNASPGSEIVYWLSGQAGAGKTTIAFTIARHFETLFNDGHGRAILGGSFFCSREFLDTRTASSIVRTIVYQLALRSKPFRAALKEHGRFETVDHGPRSQFMGLLVEPWKISAPKRRAENEPCYILPIDALDELEGAGGTEFLGALFDVVEQQDLSGLKFFVTGRSEPALVRRIESFANKQICRLEEVPLEESSADIKVYLNKALGQCATTQQIQQLVSDAAGLFIYAATVAEFVKGRSLEVQRNLLNRLLSTPPSPSRPPSPNATATLDRLYLQVLETSLVDPRDQGDPDVFQDCLSILHTFLCTIERTSAAVAVAILNENRGQNEMVIDVSIAEEILHRLHAVLYVQGNLVMSFHKSFTDFLFDARRSQRFFCNQEQHHCRLANGCFQIMAKQLRFNIAGISSSHQMDSDNPTLAACIDAKISASLKYACVNWSAHLILAPFEAPDELTEVVCQFLQLRILFWMEAMNLLGQRGRCQDMLCNAQRWFSKAKSPVDLLGQLADAEAFARYHSTSKAALSTPHLYLSSLATFPRHSAMVQNWRWQFGSIPGFTSAHGVGGGAMVACITLKDELHAFAVSLNGDHVALGLGGSSVQIWDLSTGEEVRVLKGHTRTVWAVAYSPGGTHIASASSDQSVRVWDLSTGEEVRVLKGHTDWVRAVAYSPNGTHLISGSDDKSVRVWDMSTGHEVRALEGHTSFIMAVACSPDGTQVASGSLDGLVCVWDLFTGEQVMLLEGHTNTVRAVAYSPDGTHLVSCSNDQSVRVWDMSTRDRVIVLEGHTGEVLSVDCSPDGKHAISSSMDATIRVWDLSTGKEVKVIEGHTTGIEAVAYLPDGTHVVSGSGLDSLRVWDLSAEEERRVLKGHTKGVTAVAYSPDGMHVVSGSSDNSIRIWDVSTLKEVGVLTGHTNWVQAVAYSPDGTHLVYGSDKSVQAWDLSTRREVWVLEGHTNAVRAVAYSPDGTNVISSSGSEDTSIRVWDLSTGKEVRVLKGHTQRVSAVAYSPCGTHVVSGSWDNSVRVWDMSTGDEVRFFKGHTRAVNAVGYSPDGTHVVSGSSTGEIRVWDLSTGQEVKVLKGHTDWVNALAYSPDGVHLVSGSDDKSLHVWDMTTGKQVATLKVHAGGIQSVAYSPDGTHVVFCSEDNSVHVWDVFSGHTPRYVHQEGQDGKRTGWLLSPSDPSAHLMFVRPEACVPDDFNVVTLPTSSVSYLDFSNAKFGDRWTECFTPRSL